MTKVTSAQEARAWIKENWGKLLDTNRLGEALRHYYQLAGKTAGESWEEVKKMSPNDK